MHPRPLHMPPGPTVELRRDAAARPSVEVSAQWGNGGILGCSRQAGWTAKVAGERYGKYLVDWRELCGR
jgi:hypothetical protein